MLSRLTLHHDMLAVPEVTIELGWVDRRLVLPVAPLRPILAEVGRIAEHVGTKCVMGEGVLAVAEPEHTVVIVCRRENHDVL